MAMIETARENNVLFMEAFMYRCHPQTAALLELLGDGRIGKIKAVYACFTFHAEKNPGKRLFNNNLGGGSILDVGGYPISFARMIAGTAGKTLFAEPVELHAVAQISDTSVDEYAAAVLKFSDGIIAQIFSGIQAG